MGVKKKKAKPSPKGGKLLAKIKKAKRPVAVKKLLAKANKIIVESVKAFFPAESLPQVDVPVTSTEIGSGPPKKLTIPMGAKAKAFVDKLEAASQKIFENTKRGNAAKLYVEGPDGTVSEINDVESVEVVDIAGVPTLVGKGTYTKDEGPDLSHVPSSDELTAQALKDKEIKELVEKGKLVGFKGSDFIFQQPYIPVYTTPPLVSAAELELVEWMNHTAKTVLQHFQFEPFYKTSLLKVRSMISEHFDSTVFSGGVGPPALFKTLGKQQVVHRTGLRFWHHLEAQFGKCSIEQVQLFKQVFPSEGLPATFNGPDKIITKQEIADWMTQVVQIIFDFIHWQHPCKEVLLEVRKYIENVYDEDLVPKLPHAYIVDKMIPKAGAVYSIAVRVRHMLTEKYGELPDEADDLFAEVFPLPDAKDLVALSKLGLPIGPLDLPVVKLAPTFVKSAEELKAAFGEPDMDNVQAKLVATLLKNTEEYLKAHPEAAGVGPLDGAGIVQTLAPFSAVSDKNKHAYPGKIWNEAVKKLQPKFSAEAAKDAKAAGLIDAVEGMASPFPFHPWQSAPYIEINLVLDKNKAPFLEATSDGKVLGKHPVKFVAEHLTPTGHATLSRFGVVLKGTG